MGVPEAVQDEFKKNDSHNGIFLDGCSGSDWIERGWMDDVFLI
jgi:hypothetical protein